MTDQNGVERSRKEYRDAVELLRRCAEMPHGMAALRYRLGVSTEAGWQQRCLGRLADMVKKGFARLPVDLDGVPIRVGDIVVDCGERFEVRSATLGEAGWRISDRLGTSYDPRLVRHVRRDSVEALLVEFAEEVQRCCDTEDTIAEYAGRIRKAVER